MAHTEAYAAACLYSDRLLLLTSLIGPVSGGVIYENSPFSQPCYSTELTLGKWLDTTLKGPQGKRCWKGNSDYARYNTH